MQEHDEDLVDIIHEIRERKGAGKPFNPQRLNEKLSMVGPFVGFDRLTRSIEVEIADRIGSNWDELVGVLRRFKAREGHCDVPALHREGTYRLGQWVNVQRNTKDTMSVERKQRLDAIGFIWDALEARWEDGFAALKQFKAREGHCKVPRGHREGILPLGNWVAIQRHYPMSNERKQRLDAIGFIWDPHTSEWEDGFAALKQFKAREGHCIVPRGHREGTYGLRTWVGSQRTRKNKLSNERKQRLDAIGFIWNAREARWEEGFSALEKFKAREGHCNVPAKHREGTLQLGNWVINQRVRTVSNEHRQRLNKIGFVWNAREVRWEDGFAALKQFKAREGHCNVSTSHVEGTFKLGTWVSRQRNTKDNMSKERKKRLDKLGFVWDTLETSWEDGFAALKQFKAREGHCNVSTSHVEGTFQLGRWVDRQRVNKDTMFNERKKRLDKLGFVWNALEARWEDGFAALKQFKAREGHCKVPQGYREGASFRLGQWVAVQRRNTKMSNERRQRLDKIGFVWAKKLLDDLKR